MIPDIKNSKNLTFTQQKQKEGQEILSKIQAADVVVLLDEKGKQFDPVLVDILLSNIDEFIAIRDAYPDHQG